MNKGMKKVAFLSCRNTIDVCSGHVYYSYPICVENFLILNVSSSCPFINCSDNKIGIVLESRFSCYVKSLKCMHFVLK